MLKGPIYISIESSQGESQYGPFDFLEIDSDGNLYGWVYPAPTVTWEDPFSDEAPNVAFAALHSQWLDSRPSSANAGAVHTLKVSVFDPPGLDTPAKFTNFYHYRLTIAAEPILA